MACCCANWEEFTQEIEEWGIYKLGGVDFDTLTEFDIQTLDLFIKAKTDTSERRLKMKNWTIPSYNDTKQKWSEFHEKTSNYFQQRFIRH